MNYNCLFANASKKPKAKVCIIGSNGGFGYTFMAQIPLMNTYISLRAVCDQDIEKSITLLEELGYSHDVFYPCYSEEDFKKVPSDGIIILEDAYLAPKTDADIVVEATGIPEMSSVLAEKSLLSGKHVCMVSKEADCVVGPYLSRLAKSKDLVYAIAIGDQPANLINWLSYIQTLGMEIVCAGKSSEYDFVYNLDTFEFEYRKELKILPELKQHWEYKGIETLAKRSKILSEYQQFAIPDYCEMNIVCNATGLTPSYDQFVFPICTIPELAEIYQLKADGGVLEHEGSIDTFINFRRPDEVSFAGGVFAIVKAHNRKVWDLLAEKGHVISRNRKYGCLFLPYHYMGVEAPMSVLQAYYTGLSSYHRCDNVATMACVTLRDFKAGEKLNMLTNHRYIEGVEVMIRKSTAMPRNVAPYYLVTDKTLMVDVPKGTLLTQNMLDLEGSHMKRMLDAVNDFPREY